jgi:hypothetical protein
LRRVGGRGGSAANELTMNDSRNASLACEVLSWRPITAAATGGRARLARNPRALNLQFGNIRLISLAEHLQDLFRNETRCGVRREGLHIVAEARIKTPAERCQPDDHVPV